MTRGDYEVPPHLQSTHQRTPGQHADLHRSSHPANPIARRGGEGVGIPDVSTGLEGEEARETLTGGAVIQMNRTVATDLDLDQTVAETAGGGPDARPVLP